MGEQATHATRRGVVLELSRNEAREVSRAIDAASCTNPTLAAVFDRIRAAIAKAEGR
jgi:hypothetical protein